MQNKQIILMVKVIISNMPFNKTCKVLRSSVPKWFYIYTQLTCIRRTILENADILSGNN